MALIRYLLTATVLLSAYVSVQAQTIYYPAGASQLLKSTADDIAMLLQRSIAGSHFIAQPYTSVPNNGIVLIYDAAVTDNQSCKVSSDGNGFTSFAASQDNGLNFGIYQYLHQLGFRFYQPGNIWEIIPELSSPYKRTDTVYSCKYKYKSWFISGGHNAWIMDKDNSYYWDTYNGEQGHQWALYQRRNGMTGGSRFTGHRDDILSNDYIATLQANPCYVAPYNESRVPTRQSVPNINNIASMQLWSTAIEKKYTQFSNTIFGNAAIYPNYIHNFNYNYGYVGIEVPDGAHWANSTDGTCGNTKYLKESDQHFTLANFTAAKINATYPGKHFQLYAYDGHANVPSPQININENIDIQVVPTAFQSETSAKGLLSRWYARTKNISEYHYLNLPQWSGETPSFFLDDLKTSIKRVKENKAQGIAWEASPAKFASLPFLMAANTSLIDETDIDTLLMKFCNDLFQNAAGTIYKLLQCWSNDKTVTISNGIQDNKYKLPYYFKLVNQAVNETQNAAPVVKERLNELKAYLHYMVLYYDWVFDPKLPSAKPGKAAALCLYLARINKLQLVNSYYLVQDIVWKYNTTDDIYTRFNAVNGTAYQDGDIAQITSAEIAANFTSDLQKQTAINQFSFKDAVEIKEQFKRNNLEPADKIKVKVNYTYAKDYAARTEFYLIAGEPGGFSIAYTPHFEMAGKGYINFTVEATDKTLGIVKDFSIDNSSGKGIIYIALPAAGTYKLSMVSKYKSWTDLEIITNGNYFFKNGPYLGNTMENYRGDLLSLPGYFYVPEGISKIYFSLNNSYDPAIGYASAKDISSVFNFKDNQNNTVEPALASSSDSSLFYLDVPQNAGGTFWQAFKMEQLRLCFSNTSNIQWYAKRKPCAAAAFTATVKDVLGQCITTLKVVGTGSNLKWDVYDAGRWYNYSNSNTIDLPANISPNAIITLYNSSNCITTNRIGDDAGYLKQITTCSTGAAPVEPGMKITVYPNPGNGLFRCMQNGEPVLAQDIRIFNGAGIQLAGFANTQSFNIIHLPAGLYYYAMVVNKVSYKGKVIRL